MWGYDDFGKKRSRALEDTPQRDVDGHGGRTAQTPIVRDNTQDCKYL